MRIVLMLFFGGVIGLAAQRSEAPSPPETYSLKELQAGEALIDPQFELWLKEVESYPNSMELAEKEYGDLVGTLHPTEKLLLDIKRASRQSLKQRQVLVRGALASLNTQHGLRDSILYPDMINALLETDLVPKETASKLEKEIDSWPGHSCPQKRSVLRSLDLESKELLSKEEITKFLEKISRFNSERFKEKAFERLMEMVDEDRHKELKEPLKAAIRPYSKLVLDHNWLFEEEIKQTPQKDKVLLALEKADEDLKSKRCNTAKKRLVFAIQADKQTKFLPQVEAANHKVESCFRKKGNRARLRFLSRMEKHLEAAYGFKGKEIVLRRKALIHWQRDEFDKTRLILGVLLEESKKLNDQEILGRTLYTLARVDENEGKIDQAIDTYEKFVKDFSESENTGEAMTSLIMLHTLKHQYPLALSYAEKLIELETVKKVNDRDSGLLSLALFWAGKLQLHLGDRAKTQEYWRRLASEFYSTFYGAMGHYMLETLLGKKLVLQPSRVPSFSKEAIVNVFDKNGQNVVSRIENLFKIGLKDEASCETSELGGGPDDYRKNLVKAMYLYAAGEWLNSIKKFVDLPRSFRHALPRGMEILLFPRAYAGTVHRYAERLGVEPAYVFAIIRQESVFNPNARSSVGASGLMQLMPATARLEAKSLQRGYLAGTQQKSLIESSNHSSRLFDAETNLALGIHHVHRLFSKYKNPIYVLTSYNANPRATEKWLENIDTSDALAFIERIPYRETRAYVKLVMRNYFYYKRWYEAPGNIPFMDYLAPNSIELAKAGIPASNPIAPN